MRNKQFDVVSLSVAGSEAQRKYKSKRSKSVSEFNSKHYKLCIKSVGDYKAAITAVLTEYEAKKIFSVTNTVKVSKSSHNEYYEEITDLAEYIKEDYKDFYFVNSYNENMKRLVPKLTVYKKTFKEEEKYKLVLEVDYYLKVYCDNFEYDIARRFFVPEKETYNNLELFNLGFASEEKLEQLCKFMEETFKRNPKRFRSIILFGGIQKSEGKIKLMHNDKIKKLFIIISKFKTGFILLIDFELTSDIFIQIIQTTRLHFMLVFINCLIVKKIIESYEEINFKSSGLIQFLNCKFESNNSNDITISDKCCSKLSYVIKYISSNKYWEKHLNKIFLFNSFEHDFYILCHYNQRKKAKNLSEMTCYLQKIKQFLKILKNFKYLEKDKKEVQNIKIFNNSKLFEITGFEDQEQYFLKYTETNSSDPDFEIKTCDCKAKDLNMNNIDIFEYFNDCQTKQLILLIRGYNLVFAVHFKDGNVKFYDPYMREDLLCIDSEILVFNTIILGNNDPLNISKLDITGLSKYEDYTNYSYNNITCNFVFSAFLCPKFKKIVIDGYSNLNYEVLQEVCDIAIRDKKIIIDATKAKAYQGQNKWKIAIQ